MFHQTELIRLKTDFVVFHHYFLFLFQLLFKFGAKKSRRHVTSAAAVEAPVLEKAAKIS